MNIKLDKLDIKQIRTLVKLYELRSITRVAEFHGVSQQSISEQLKKCRIIFNNQLFIRSGRGIAPTPAAEEIIKALEEILNILERTSNGKKFNPKEIDKVIIISGTDYAQEFVILQLIKKLRKESPNLKIITCDLAIKNLEKKMEKGLIDYAITVPDFSPAKLPFLKLFSDTYSCVGCINSNIPNKLKLKELNNYNHIIVSPEKNNLIGSSNHWFNNRNIKRKINTSLSSFTALPKFISGTDSIAFIPTKMLPNKLLKDIYISETPPGFDLILTWHPRMSQDPIHKWLVEIIKDSIKKNQI